MKNRWAMLGAAIVLGMAGMAGCKKDNTTDESAPPASNSTTTSSPTATNNPPGPSASAGNAANNAANKTANTAENAADKVTDATTTAKVKNALMTTKEKMDWKSINVDTKNGEVILRGAVGDANQKANAVKIAQQAAGSKYKVVDQLTVNKGAK